MHLHQELKYFLTRSFLVFNVALAVLEDDRETAAITVYRALANLPRSMAAFAPKGSYPEGPGYGSSGPRGYMDIGSFVLDADGMRWTADLGAESYHRIESRGMNF